MKNIFLKMSDVRICEKGINNRFKLLWLKYVMNRETVPSKEPFMPQCFRSRISHKFTLCYSIESVHPCLPLQITIPLLVGSSTQALLLKSPREKSTATNHGNNFFFLRTKFLWKMLLENYVRNWDRRTMTPFLLCTA